MLLKSTSRKKRKIISEKLKILKLLYISFKLT